MRSAEVLQEELGEALTTIPEPKKIVKIPTSTYLPTGILPSFEYVCSCIFPLKAVIKCQNELGTQLPVIVVIITFRQLYLHLI